MSKSRISDELRAEIVAQFCCRCAYCQTQQNISGIRLTIDHIVPEVLGGTTEKANLCLACWDCNLYKAARISALDEQSQRHVRLFHPQQQVWSEHFEWSSDSSLIIGKTIVGQVSIAALQMNRAQLVISRKLWAEVGWHPPDG